VVEIGGWGFFEVRECWDLLLGTQDVGRKWGWEWNGLMYISGWRLNQVRCYSLGADMEVVSLSDP
jgi:hypothetical protein